MTPSEIIALVRDTALVVGVGLILWFTYKGGENAVKVGDLKALQAQIQQQADTLSKWRGESNDAQATLSREVASINAAPTVVHDWVQQPACPKPAVLPTAAAKAGGQPPSAGGFQPGPGDAARADRRDFAVAEFKRKWEERFAGCRALEASWPQ